MSAAAQIQTSLYIKKMANAEAQFRNIHQDLIDGCKIGDSKAQFEIYKLYYKTMYNTSLRIVNDQMEAEDIMQEAFLSAFEKIGSYSGTVSFGAWLKKIVVNRSLDALDKRKEIFEDIDLHREIRDESGDEANSHEELDIKVEKIKEAIDALPDGYRIILSLYLLEGYDHDEIAEIMSITSSTSRSQLTRAKQKLISDLKEKYAI
jgi:RNA polymerase sigma-70 factor (ECF subfamily)